MKTGLMLLIGALGCVSTPGFSVEKPDPDAMCKDCAHREHTAYLESQARVAPKIATSPVDEHDTLAVTVDLVVDLDVSNS